VLAGTVVLPTGYGAGGAAVGGGAALVSHVVGAVVTGGGAAVVTGAEVTGYETVQPPGQSVIVKVVASVAV